MNDLNNVAPITITLATAASFQSLMAEVSTAAAPQDSSSCALSATAMLQYTICRRILETFNE